MRFLTCVFCNRKASPYNLIQFCVVEDEGVRCVLSSLLWHLTPELHQASVVQGLISLTALCDVTSCLIQPLHCSAGVPSRVEGQSIWVTTLHDVNVYMRLNVWSWEYRELIVHCIYRD